jgi:hypothetical protein
MFVARLAKYRTDQLKAARIGELNRVFVQQQGSGAANPAVDPFRGGDWPPT